jgi:hypothetical protein
LVSGNRDRVPKTSENPLSPSCGFAESKITKIAIYCLSITVQYPYPLLWKAKVSVNRISAVARTDEFLEGT